MPADKADPRSAASSGPFPPEVADGQGAVGPAGSGAGTVDPRHSDPTGDLPMDTTTAEGGGDAPEIGDGEPLRVLVARNFGWSLVGQLLQRGLVWLSTIVLVHILDREDYGTYSIAITVTMLLLALNDLAVGHAITRYQGD